MDVDPPNLCSNLKRSCSAPMINILTTSQPKMLECLPQRDSTPPGPFLLGISRTRRFSASFSPNSSPSSTPNSTAPLSPVVPSRVSQIKQEEGMDVMFREAAHEKETQSRLQFSQSWEDLTLDDPTLSDTSKRPRLTEPLHIFTVPMGNCSSPTQCRTGKQCFSPSTCLPVRTSAFSPTSPSPTRKNLTSRRSQSPISLRPSQFSLKRKHDMDIDSADSLPIGAKRFSLDNYPPLAHPLVHSLSSSMLETTAGSPEQTVPHICGDISDSMSSCDGSPYSAFKPLDPAPLIQENMEETPV